MDKFLGTYNLPRLDHEDIENPNWLITSKEIESTIKNHPTNKSPGPNNFSDKLYQVFKADLIWILKLLKRVEEEKTLPNSGGQHYLHTHTSQDTARK